MSDQEDRIDFLAQLANAAARCQQLIGDLRVSQITEEGLEDYATTAAWDFPTFRKEMRVEPGVVKAILAVVENKSTDEIHAAGEAAWDAHLAKK